MWKQIIEKSKVDEVSVIFVTDDQKEDWWQIAAGKTIGPRPELIDEFFEETKNDILIYTPNAFLGHAESQLGAKVSDNTIDEVEAEFNKRTFSKKRQRRYKFIPRNVLEDHKKFGGDGLLDLLLNFTEADHDLVRRLLALESEQRRRGSTDRTEFLDLLRAEKQRMSEEIYRLRSNIESSNINPLSDEGRLFFSKLGHLEAEHDELSQKIKDLIWRLDND